MADGESTQNVSVSQLVTVNQNGVIAINAIVQALTTLATKFPDWVAVPATASSSGVAGQVAYDATHFYVCVAADTWVRVALATF